MTAKEVSVTAGTHNQTCLPKQRLSLYDIEVHPFTYRP